MKSTSTITSITTGPRQSNIELLRIVAMFLVLVVHSDFWSLGSPKYPEFLSSPANAIIRTMIESISIVCVNIFVLISGWFGIRFGKKGLLNFIFQCGYFLFGIYIFLLLTGQVPLSPKGVAGCLCLTKANWFIRAYVGLYLLSPVLNIFTEHVSKKMFKNVLILFFLFQTIYGWTNAAKFVELGYSTFSFIGLYLLARYIRKYNSTSLTAWGGTIYVVTIVINAILYYLAVRFRLPVDVYAYVNPLVILGALGLFGFFWRMRISANKFINWIAKSSFAVFLLHTNPNIGVPIFQVKVIELYNTYSGLGCLVMLLIFLLVVFFISVLLDQPRKWIWKRLAESF